MEHGALQRLLALRLVGVWAWMYSDETSVDELEEGGIES